MEWSSYQKEIIDYYSNNPHDNIIVKALAGCVDCDTEFFNGYTWKKISEYQEGDKVLQWNNGKGELVDPINYIKLPCDTLYHFETKYGLDQCLSNEHTIYYLGDGGKGNLCSCSFEEFKHRHEMSKTGFTGRFITTFSYEQGIGIDLTDAEIKLMCAVICDGTFNENHGKDTKTYKTCRFHIKKDRKKKKLRELFQEANLTWKEKESSEKGYTDFYIIPPRHEKVFSRDWYNCTRHQLWVICNNVLFWDGNENLTEHNAIRKRFTTTVKETADFIQFAFTACGYRATIKFKERKDTLVKTNNKEYYRISNDYDILITNTHSNTVGMMRRTDLGAEKVPIKPYPTKDGFKYCFTVPSGKWMMRRGYKICMTGNSGKTTLLKELTDLSTKSDIYVAFNNTIAKEMSEKVTNPKVKVKTLHALAYSIMISNVEQEQGISKGIGKTRNNDKLIKLDNLKPYKIVEDIMYTSGRRYDFTEKIFYLENYVTLYNLARLTRTDMSDPDAVKKLCDEYNLFIDYENEFERPSEFKMSSMLEAIDEASFNEFDTNHTIDFTDMLYITYTKINNKEWEIPYYNFYSNILVDEAQDLSNLQLAFLKFIKRKGGRYIFVLDENQAIYSFAGGNSQSFKAIPKLFTPIKEFDLPICYRCPKSHLNRVNKQFGIPIQARLNAPEGKIFTIEKHEIVNIAKIGDMVIARKNKWLTDVILALAKNGTPIYMQDKEMVETIKRTIIKQKSNNLQSLRDKLENVVKKYNQKVQDIILNADIESHGGNEAPNTESDVEKRVQITSTNAKIDNIEFIIDILNDYMKKHTNDTPDDFLRYLDKLLNTTDPHNCVRLTSVHKAKGLEANNVLVLNEAKVCVDPRNSWEQNEQEKNLSYISITRAKNNLYLVIEPKK